jgi:hypothetical protein
LLCKTTSISLVAYKFKPSNYSKYDGKTEPNQWLHIYSQSIELAGGDDDINTLLFTMALEAVPLQWFDKLSPRSIMCWDDLQKVFLQQLRSILTHPATRVELRGCTQKKDESFWEYYRRFGELGSQVHVITEREVIDDFSMGIRAKWQF